MKSLYGADCSNCGYEKGNGCKGCEASKGCPYSKQYFLFTST